MTNKDESAERYLTEADVEALAKAISANQAHLCRFDGVDRDKLVRAIATSEHIEAVMAEAGSAIRVTIIKGGLWALGVVIILGVIVKVREWVKIPLP